MSKTPFSKKCEILGALWSNYKDKDDLTSGWSVFFRNNDIGCPLAFMLWQGLVTAKPSAKEYVEQSWTAFCVSIGIDPADKYTDLKHTFNEADKIRKEIEEYEG